MRAAEATLARLTRATVRFPLGCTERYGPARTRTPLQIADSVSACTDLCTHRASESRLDDEQLGATRCALGEVVNFEGPQKVTYEDVYTHVLIDAREVDYASLLSR